MQGSPHRDPRLQNRRSSSPPRRSAVLELSRLECQVHIGVDDEERSARQRVVIDLRAEGAPGMDEAGLRDPLEREIRRYLTEGRFVLVEATILGMARRVFELTQARRVSIRFHKFVLPGTDYVAVEMAFLRRNAVGSAPGSRR